MMHTRDEEGVVLLLVLVIVVLTISSVYAFARTSLLYSLSEKHRMDRARAELLARSGQPVAIRALQDDLITDTDPIAAALESGQDVWGLLSRHPIEVPGDGELRITIRDAGTRINLNALVDAEGAPHEESRAFLMAALEKIVADLPGRSEEKLYAPEDLADAILDWIDSDDQTRLGDEEAQLYERQGAASAPVDRPIWTLGELAGIPGVDAELLQALAAYFTTYPVYPDLEQSGVNPNTAPPHVLAMIYEGTTGEKQLLDENDVFTILRAREEERIFCPQTSEEDCVSFQSELGRVGETIFPPLGFTSDVFWIRTEGRFGEARACIESVVDRKELSDIQVLSYRMGC